MVAFGILITLSAWSLNQAYDQALLDQMEKGVEVPPNPNDEFLTALFRGYFGCQEASLYDVQHGWYAGTLHHKERFIIKLKPELFAQLERQMSTKVKIVRPALFLKSAHDSDWWTPPNKAACHFETNENHDLPNVQGTYKMEYDPTSELLYLEGNTV